MKWAQEESSLKSTQSTQSWIFNLIIKMAEEKAQTVYKRIEECVDRPGVSEYCWLNPELAEKDYSMCPLRGKMIRIISQTLEGVIGSSKVICEKTESKFVCLKSVELALQMQKSGYEL